MTAPSTFARWSKSGVDSLINGCSWKVYLNRVRRLPDPGGPQAALGTAYHAALEYHERARLLHLRDGAPWDGGRTKSGVYAGMLGAAVDALNAELDGLPDDALDKHGFTVQSLGDGLKIALDHWWDAPIPEGQPGAGGSLRDRVMRWRPVAVEPYFLTEVEGAARPIHGWIDVLYWDPDAGRYVVVDQKSVAHFKSWPLTGGHELEAGVYVLGAELAASLPPTADVRMEWHLARRERGTRSNFQGARVVTQDVGEAERAFALGALARADSVVDLGLFEKNPGWNLCSPKWCAFHKDAGGPCDPEVPAHEDPLSDPAWIAEPVGLEPRLLDSLPVVGTN